jgi:hypothetical protein
MSKEAQGADTEATVGSSANPAGKPKVTFPGKIALWGRLARVVSPVQIERQRDFYETLVDAAAGQTYCDNEILVLVVVKALTRRGRGVITSSEIGIHIDALVGEEGREVGLSVRAMIEGIGVKMMRRQGLIVV